MTKERRNYFILFTLVLVFLGIMFTNINVLKSYAVFLKNERQKNEPQMMEVSQDLSRAESNAVRRSHHNAVGIVSVSATGGISSFSGTVFSYGGRNYVITVAHGLLGGCRTAFIILSNNSIAPCKEIVILDQNKDYSIIELGPLADDSMSPIHLDYILLRSDRHWQRAVSLQQKIYYTGFPNGTGPLTISGEIIGFQEDKYIFVHSYAWSGSSGSGIFSGNGKFLGVLLAVEIGSTSFGIQILEDVVIILPATSIDWGALRIRE